MLVKTGIMLVWMTKYIEAMKNSIRMPCPFGFLCTIANSIYVESRAAAALVDRAEGIAAGISASTASLTVMWRASRCWSPQAAVSGWWAGNGRMKR